MDQYPQNFSLVAQLLIARTISTCHQQVEFITIGQHTLLCIKVFFLLPHFLTTTKKPHITSKRPYSTVRSRRFPNNTHSNLTWEGIGIEEVFEKKKKNLAPSPHFANCFFLFFPHHHLLLLAHRPRLNPPPAALDHRSEHRSQPSPLDPISRPYKGLYLIVRRTAAATPAANPLNPTTPLLQQTRRWKAKVPRTIIYKPLIQHLESLSKALYRPRSLFCLVEQKEEE